MMKDKIMKNKSIIFTVTILILITLTGTIIIIKDMAKGPVNPVADYTQTNPPDTLPFLFVYNQNLIEVEGNHIMISPSVQTKIDNADFLGLTVDWTASNEVPTEELQTNFIGKGCSVYYYKDDSTEVYIFIDVNKTNFCFYQTPK